MKWTTKDCNHNISISNGNLDLSWAKDPIELPDKLVVPGDLDLLCATISKWPHILIVKGNIYAENSVIHCCPVNLSLGGKIVCYVNSPLVNLAFEGYEVEIVDKDCS